MSTQRLPCTMFIPDVKDKVEDATAVMQREVRNSQTVQMIVRIPQVQHIEIKEVLRSSTLTR